MTDTLDENERWQRWAIASVALIAALCYANAIANGYVQDDQGIIHDNPLVKTVTGLWRAFIHPYWPERNGAGQYRPLVIASFVIDRGILHFGAWWFHLENILWHVGVCLLVYRLLLLMLPLRGAWFGAAWFAVHPVHVEAVSNGVGRCELMASAFVLLAFFAHRERKRTAILWFALALASKESGIVFLALAALNDLLLGRAPRGAQPDTVVEPSLRELYISYAGVTAVYAGILTLIFQHQLFVATAVTWDGASAVDRWLTMLRVVPEIARLLLAPVELKVDYTPRTIDLVTSVTPAVILGATLVIASIVAGIAAWRRAPAVTFGIAWFYIAVSPVSNVLFPSGVVLAERTLYLPTVGAAIVAGWVFQQAIEVRPRVMVVFATALFVAFAIRTWTRTPFWHDKRHFLMSEVDQQPESYRAHFTVCVLMDLEKKFSAGAFECRTARRLHPSDIGPYVDGAEAAGGMHDTVTAEVLLDSALHMMPGDFATLLTFARLRRAQGRDREAIALAFSAYESAPDSIMSIDELTAAAQRLHDFTDAEAAFRRGLADHPSNAHLHQGYAAMLMDRGDTAAARRQLAYATSGAVAALFTH
jgi:protein O-mannosyl-transferase